MPEDFSAFRVPSECPRADSRCETFCIGFWLGKSLPTQNTQFNLSHIQPASMFWSIVPLKALRQPPDRQRYRRSHSSRSARPLPAIHHTGHLHPRLRQEQESGKRSPPAGTGNLKLAAAWKQHLHAAASFYVLNNSLREPQNKPGDVRTQGRSPGPQSPPRYVRRPRKNSCKRQKMTV